MKGLNIYILLFLVIPVLTFHGCTKEAEREFARVRTLEATNISQSGAILNGEITNLKDSNPDECGFIIYSGEPSELSLEGIVPADYSSETGQITYSIETGIINGYTYFYKAFAIANTVTSIGNLKSFESRGSNPPVPFDFTPKTGQVGDTIALVLGNNVGIISGYNVEFNGLKADIIGFNGSTLDVIVPVNLNTTESSVTIESNGVKSAFDNYFVLLAPEVLSFSPSSVYAGQEVSISGNNFHRVEHLNIVRFNGTIAPVIQSDRNTLIVSAPNIYAPDAIITVSVSGQVASAQQTIEVHGEPVIWEQVADFPINVYRAQGFSIYGYGYAGTGDAGYPINNFWKYDPLDDNWSSIADFPGQPRVSPVAVSIDGIGYVGGGMTQPFNQQSLTDYYSYDPSNDQWQPISDNPGPTDDSYVELFEVIGNKLFVSTSWTSLNYLSVNPVSWNDVSENIPELWSASASFVIDNKMYVVYGKHYPSGDLKNEVWMYDPFTGLWVRKNDFPGIARAAAVGFSIKGKGYMGLGWDNSQRLDDMWEYDSINDTWTRIAQDFPGGRTSSAFVFIINEAAYIGTGVKGTLTRVNSVYRFTPIN